jgi:hypothetical protein
MDANDTKLFRQKLTKPDLSILLIEVHIVIRGCTYLPYRLAQFVLRLW